MWWRPWAVVGGLVLSAVLSGVLVYQEKIPDGEVRQVISLQNEPLRHVSYRPANRIQNFIEMGMSTSHAEETAKLARKLDKNRKRYSKLLREQALDIADCFCPKPSELPQPYAAMRVLVVQEGKDRDVVDAHNGLFAFEDQPWFSEEGLATSVYNTLERAKDRQPNATLMGVAAVLTKKESAAMKHQEAWATGIFGGSFANLKSNIPSIQQKTVEYFALMHVLTEIANDPDGICSQ